MNACAKSLRRTENATVVTFSAFTHYVCYSDIESAGPPQPHDHGSAEPFVPPACPQATIGSHYNR